MFQGRFDVRNGIVPSVMGGAVIPMVIEGDNLMFTYEYDIFGNKQQDVH